MLGMQVVIEKDRVVRALTQQLHRLAYVISDVNKVAFEATRKPAMSPFIVVKKKNTNRMTFGVH
jgi:hypothetical protein